MALRILTGIVNITSRGPKSGRVRIGFNPHARISGDATVVERTSIGPARRFVAVPGKHVALRQITLLDLDADTNRFTVNDSINRDRITIRWRGKGGAFSEEISYLIVGEVADAIPARRPRPRARRPK